MRTFALLLAALVLPLASACGGGDEAADTGTGGTGGTGGTAAQTVDVSAVDFAFEPADISVEPGAVAFALANEGSAPHALAIEGNGVDVSSDTIDAGASTTLETELEEGTYEIYCPVGDHRDRGMVGTLTVGSGGGAGGTGTSTDGTGTSTDETTTGADTGGTETSGGDDSAGSGLGGGY